MNYIELINHYWQLREQGILDAGSGDLYLYLIHKSNSLGWKNPFNQSNGLIRAVINVSEPTLIRQRNVLKQLGLIEFESGKSLRKNSTYYLKNISSVVSSVVSSPVSGVISRDDVNPLDYNKHKQEEIKENNEADETSAPTPRISKEEKIEKRKQREKDFYQALLPFLPKYNKDILRKFYNYWSEPNKSGTKMKWELENTWELERRLEKWQDNDDKWSKNNKTPNNDATDKAADKLEQKLLQATKASDS